MSEASKAKERNLNSPLKRKEWETIPEYRKRLKEMSKSSCRYVWPKDGKWYDITNRVKGG